MNFGFYLPSIPVSPPPLLLSLLCRVTSQEGVQPSLLLHLPPYTTPNNNNMPKKEREGNIFSLPLAFNSLGLSFTSTSPLVLGAQLPNTHQNPNHFIPYPFCREPGTPLHSPSPSLQREQRLACLPSLLRPLTDGRSSCKGGR